MNQNKFISFSKIAKTITSLILLLISANLHAQWRSANPYNSSINDVFFADRLTGYACGNSIGLGNCSATASILRTIDGGENWIRMNTGSTAAMYRLHFVDAFTGWAVGNSSTVLKTTDGGQSWTTQTSGVGAGYNSIHFPTPQVGYVVGQNGIVRKSTNGGSTWTTIASGSTTIRDVWFVNPNLGFYVGNNGVLFRTSNGGGSFQSVYSGSDFLKEAWFADEQIGYAMSSNKLLKTTNGGNSWSSFDAEEGQIWLRMNWVNANTGYIFGDLNLILKTNDGGETWQQIPSEFNDAVTVGFFIDENYGFVGGDRGRITKTEDGGQTWNNTTAGLGSQQGLSFRTPELGISVAASGRIFRTKNAGLNMKRMPSGTNRFLSSVRWLDDNVILVCGDGGFILRSEDSGFTWDSIATPTTEFLNDLWAPDAQTAYACGASGTIIKSSDAGLTWEDQSVDTEEFLDGIHFLNANYGMTVGRNEIYRTLDGGATWELKNTDVVANTSFNDVWIANDSLAYAAGTFGKFYWTNNGGEAWEGIFPTSNSNAEIDEMVFINDTVGYFARLNSQSITLNGGFLIGSMSTYCLANNGGVDAIEVVHQNGKTYGYCAGGISSVFHTLAPDSLSQTYLQDSIFCSGSRIFVGYLATGLLFNQETIIAQLSDAEGSFDNPVNIGSYTLVSPNRSPAGIITCNLPGGLNGNGYRIRVVCEDPQLIAPDNGYDLRIQSSIEPQLSLLANPPAACGGEPVTLTTQGIGLGSNATYSWTINGEPIVWESSILTLDTLSTQAEVELVATSSLACASTPQVSASLIIDISEAPIAIAGEDIEICPGDEVLIGDNGNGNSTWTPQLGLSNPDAGQTIASPETSTTYTLTVTNNEGCTATDEITINLSEIPFANAGEDAMICSGDAVIIGSSDNINPNWEPQLGLENPAEGLTFASPAQSITYFVSVTNEAGCVAIDSVTIDVNPLPTANAGEDTGHCLFQTVQIGSDENTNASWFPPIGLSDPNSPQPVASLTETTEFTLTVTSNEGCQSFDTILVNLFPTPEVPVIELSGAELIIPGNPQGMINWYLNGDLLEGETNDTLPITAVGDYTVRIENEFECSVLSEPFEVTTVSIASIAQVGQAFLTNTPSGWLLNKPEIDNLSYSIYDLQGRLLGSGTLNANHQLINYPTDTEGVYLIHTINKKGVSRIFKAVR